MAGLIRLIYAGWTPPADPRELFTGQTVIVTGSNIGLGFEAAVKLAQRDVARLILGVRTLAKGEAAKKAIEERLTNKGKGPKIDVWELNMLSYDSIQQFAQRVDKEVDRLDAAILNAGVISAEYGTSAYGWETTLQVNVISTALLGLLLLPKLKAASKLKAKASGAVAATRKPALEIVGSGAHKTATISAEHREAENLLDSYSNPKPTPEGKSGYSVGQQYGISKLLVMYVMQTLASFTKKEDMLVLTVCPGPCKSDLARGYNGFLLNTLKAVVYALMTRTTEQGSRTYVSGLTLGEEAHGGFWQSDEVLPPVPLVSGEEGEALRKQVWSEVIEGLKKDIPSVVKEALAKVEA